MASWKSNGWIDYNGGRDNSGWSNRSRGWNDRSGWDDRSGHHGYNRPWEENEWQTSSHVVINNGCGLSEVDEEDSQEENDSINGSSSGLDEDSRDVIEMLRVQDSRMSRNNEEPVIQAPFRIPCPQSRPSGKSEPMKIPIGSTYYANAFSCTPVLQPFDSNLHEELRKAYQDNVEVQGTSSTDPPAVAVPSTSSTNPTAVEVPSTSSTNQTAVAEAPPELWNIPKLVLDRSDPPFDLAYFQRFGPFTGGYKQHNIALKWFRLFAERRTHNFIQFDNHRPVNVPVCEHPKGMAYSFDETRTNMWTWQEMVAQLDEESMKRVVEGPNAAVAEGSNAAVAEGLPKHIVACGIVKTDRYDHKRNFALKDWHTVYHIWDFVFFRSDGSQIGIHPEYSKTKFASYEGEARSDHELPRGGKGGSSGPGTYNYFKKKGIDQYLRFDAKKNVTALAPQLRQTQ